MGIFSFYPAPRATKYLCLTSQHIWKHFVGTVAKIFLNEASPHCVSALQFLYITQIHKFPRVTFAFFRCHHQNLEFVNTVSVLLIKASVNYSLGASILLTCHMLSPFPDMKPANYADVASRSQSHQTLCRKKTSDWYLKPSRSMLSIAHQCGETSSKLFEVTHS